MKFKVGIATKYPFLETSFSPDNVGYCEICDNPVVFSFVPQQAKIQFNCQCQGIAISNEVYKDILYGNNITKFREVIIAEFRNNHWKINI